MTFTESIVEDATLNWFGELGYSLLHGQEIAPGKKAADRTTFGEAFLPDRLRAALRKLNPKLPVEALDDAYRKITIPTGPNLTAQNRAIHRMLVDGIAVECRRKDLPAPRPGPFFVYAIRCDDDSLYMGQTDDLERRWDEQVAGMHGRKWKA